MKMNTNDYVSRSNGLEKRVATVGFLLSGLVIAVVGVSYILNSNYPIKFLVWVIGIAFVGVGLLAIEWSRAFRKISDVVPSGNLRSFLILAIPVAFILDTQICGLGLSACSTLCHVISYTMIALGVVTAIRLYQGKSVGGILVPMVIVGLIPHCMCGAPINTIWQSLLGGYAPTCQVIPLATTLFSITALRGARTKWSALMVAVLLIVTLFIVVGNPLWGFPWKGCIG
jgi:hypothetical protein